MNFTISINATFNTELNVLELNNKLSELQNLVRENLEKEEYNTITLSSSLSGSETLNMDGMNGSQSIYLYKDNGNNNYVNAELPYEQYIGVNEREAAEIN